MSAARQLDLDSIFGGLPLKSKKKKKDPASWTTCRCGHEQALHMNRRNTGACSYCVAGACKRFKPKGRKPVEQPPHLRAPTGAIILERDDTKKSKEMGWAIVRPIGPDGIAAFNGLLPDDAVEAARAGGHGLHAIIYLAQLKTQSPNNGFFGKGMSKAMLAKMGAMQTAYRDACRERTISAIAQLGVDVVARGRPSSIRVTRVSTGTLDRHDNLRGALKFVVDGIAVGLGFNDAELADSASRAGDIPISYAQEKPGAAKVRGVRIELTWRTP